MSAKQIGAMEYKGYFVRWSPYKDMPDAIVIKVTGEVNGELYTQTRLVEKSTSFEPDGTPSRDIIHDLIGRIDYVRAMTPERREDHYRRGDIDAQELRAMGMSDLL